MPDRESRVRQSRPVAISELLGADGAAAVLRDALQGSGQFVDARRVLDALDWQLAGRKPAGAEHSIRRIAAHVVFWQDLYLERLAGAERPSPPHDAAGWPGGDAPRDEREWKALVARFADGLSRAMAAIDAAPLGLTLPRWGGRTRFAGLNGIALHNAYHLGQVVVLRRMLGAWPPPGGGDSW
ncbi:MAG: DinB family protein [Gemmatimonadaceae bacterium]